MEVTQLEICPPATHSHHHISEPKPTVEGSQALEASAGSHSRQKRNEQMDRMERNSRGKDPVSKCTIVSIFLTAVISQAPT